MIICSCRVISDRDIDAVAATGTSRCADVFRRCGAAPQCGTCVPMIREMLVERGLAVGLVAGAGD
ncbi:MAG: bacterioferritin-associated ferredoxin [Alphaproteobacteria bacterium]